MTSNDNPAASREDMTEDQLDAICAEHPGVAASNLAALTANYRDRLPKSTSDEQPETATPVDAGDLHRHAAEAVYTPPQGDLEIEKVTVTCSCGESWTTYLPFGAWETYQSGGDDRHAPYFAQWRTHTRAIFGSTDTENVSVLQMALEAIEHLVDERGELIAERDQAIARVETEEAHTDCAAVADLDRTKEALRTADDARKAAVKDAKNLRTQRAAYGAAAAVIIVVLTIASIPLWA